MHAKLKKPVEIKVYCNSDTKLSEKFEDGALPGNLQSACIRNELVKYKNGLDSLPNGDSDHSLQPEKAGSIPDLGEAGGIPDPGESGSIPDPGEVSSIPDSGNCDWESEQGRC